MTKGIDVSVHNGTINWEKVKKTGIDFAILRAGYGQVASQKDKKFDENYNGCKKNEIATGAYWYNYATSVSAAQAEARVCLSILANRKFDYPIWYDIEEQKTFNTGKNNVSAIAKAFCEIVKAAGYKVGIYSSKSGLNSYFTDEIKNKYDIWVANVGKNGAPLSSTNYKGHVMWQYSWVGKVDGIVGNVDMDYCYKDYIEVKPAPTIEPAKPTIPVEPVSPLSSNGINVYYRVSPNGNKWYSEVKNTEDYAGLDNRSIMGFTGRTDKGTLKYRVHLKGGRWLGWISKSNINDWNWGVAGIKGKYIDAIQMQLIEAPGFEVSYRVSTTGTSSWLPWVIGTNDYAGIIGKNIDKIEVKIVKK